MTTKILIPEFKINQNLDNKIFINENSRNINKNFYNEKEDKIVQYLDLESETRILECKYLENISLQLLDIFKKTLNDLHSSQHSSKYWQIILRPWLYTFLYSTRNRFLKIQHILENYDDISFFGKFNFHKTFTPQETKDFNLIHCTNEWNNYIYYELFKVFNKDKILNNEITEFVPRTEVESLLQNNIKKKIDTFLKVFDFGNNKIFIHKSGMNFCDEFLLNLLLFQFPRFYYEKSIKNLDFDLKLRKKFKSLFNENIIRKGDLYFDFLNQVIPNQIPSMVLEGFDTYKSTNLDNTYPKKPSVIFTSNSFNTNEVFKFYLAQHKEQKSVTYLVGQHGNHYNTNIFNEFLPELYTADKFINWGIEKKNQINFCNFLTKPIDYSKSNKKHLLIILRSIGEKRTLFDQELHNKYCEKFLIQFMSNLDTEKIKSVIVKPHFNHNLNNLFYSNLKLKYPNLKILNKNVKINKFFNSCRLVVYNYDATSYLQLLSSNFPTLAFWYGNDRHVVKEMKPIYETMKKNYLWSSDPIKLAKIINENWNNIHEWWYEEKRQEAISKIKTNLCKPRDKMFIFKLAKILKSFL